ncbi:MAG: hypothetical protein WAW02_07825 [Sideroxyarcus sp.]
MNHLHLSIPDLFPPQDIATEVCAGLHLPALEKLLARGNASTAPAETLETKLCAAFGVQAVAPVRAVADGVEVGAAYWLCADPVSLQLNSSQVLLLPNVMPSQEEAIALCASLNEHFSGMGVYFSAPHPQRWYVQVDAEPQMTTTALRQVAWRDAKIHFPQGADALRWQRIATEAQMLLHAHPLNQARATRGELPINSLWFWGGGRAIPLAPAFDAAGGDYDLTGAFARAAGMRPVESLPTMLDGQYASGLWICSAQGEALQRGDLYAWREAVQQIERQYAQPLLKALQAGRLQRLTLEVLREATAHRFELTRVATWKLWRGARPLARYAV